MRSENTSEIVDLPPMAKARSPPAPLKGRTGLQHGAFVPAALATVTVVTPLEGPTGAAPLAASLRQLKPSNYQTLQAILAQALVAGAEAEQNTEPPSACSPPHGSPTFRIAAVQPIQPATSATATAAADALPVAAAPVAPPECPQSQQAGSTAMRALRACARLLTGQRRHEHPTLEQELAEQVLHMVQAAAASQPIPAEQHSKTLVQAVAAWYVDNVLQEPRALIKDGGFALKSEGWTLRQRRRSDKDLAGSASRAELTNLLQAFGRPLAEELAAQSSITLQAAVAAQDALLAAQGRGMMQRTAKCGGIDWVVVTGRRSLPQQALQATMGHLSTLGRCLAFRTTLAQAVAAVTLGPAAERKGPASLWPAEIGTQPPPIGNSLHTGAPSAAASLEQLPPLTTGNMDAPADPALSQAVSRPENAQRWTAWRSVTGPHASPKQTARMWEDLGNCGAMAQLYHHLEAVRRCMDASSGRLRTAAGPPMMNTYWRYHISLHW